MRGASARSRRSSCCDAWQTHAIPTDLPDAFASGQRPPGHRGRGHAGGHRDGAVEAVAAQGHPRSRHTRQAAVARPALASARGRRRQGQIARGGVGRDAIDRVVRRPVLLRADLHHLVHRLPHGLCVASRAVRPSADAVAVLPQPVAVGRSLDENRGRYKHPEGHLRRFDPQVATYVLTVGGMFAVMFVLNWRIGLIAVATLPFLSYSLLHLYRKTKASVKKQRRQEGKVASRMSEVLSAIPLVQAFAREKYEEEQFDAVTAETVRESIRVARLEAAATRSSEIITALG